MDLVDALDYQIYETDLKQLDTVAASPDGRLVAAEGGYLYKPVYYLMVWDLSSGR